MTNLSSPRRSAGFARQLGFAVALASGTTLLSVPGFTGAAYAQKKKKDGKEAPKAAYTEAFVKAYQPIETALKAPTPDFAALKPQIQALVPLANTPDEKSATGAMMYNSGIISKDPALQMQGADLMIGSGKLTTDEAGKYNVVAAQLSAQLKQYDKARAYLQTAIDLKYTGQGGTPTDLQISLADLYLNEGRTADGLKVLSDVIAARKAEGVAVEERIYQRGVKLAYDGEIVPQVYEFSRNWVADYPTADNWRDTINIVRNLNDFELPVMLDLLRLGKQVGVLKDKNDYVTYIEAANPRRLPAEVKAVIDEANAKGVIPKGSDSWVEEQAKSANNFVNEDRTALPVLERDANASAAQLSTVLAAGDSFLSRSEYAKAAAFYQKALGMPGADRNLLQTRLGIAQIGLGQSDAARETLGKVEGPRALVAQLWAAYAGQKVAATTGGAASGF